ncbi:DUF2283 domain-containing protein [Trueperella pecoris]|uniref:DUF2283 domain-containing protein n=1 Tax=Trueperella pecoris TaxID=2733571 RepID=A0A7M1R179_9ACTO|nr:DUF2283 domain-containing protein [Trueperella pecoris]QOR47903.1 DUF2283 domain-containing protein [Trueperella pecoris]
MRLTYDSEADAAYIELPTTIGVGKSVRNIILDDLPLKGSLIIDVDKDGHLLGIEILGAASVLPPEVLHDADPL